MYQYVFLIYCYWFSSDKGHDFFHSKTYVNYFLNVFGNSECNVKFSGQETKRKTSVLVYSFFIDESDMF